MKFLSLSLSLLIAKTPRFSSKVCLFSSQKPHQHTISLLFTSLITTPVHQPVLSSHSVSLSSSCRPPAADANLNHAIKELPSFPGARLWPRLKHYYFITELPWTGLKQTDRQKGAERERGGDIRDEETTGLKRTEHKQRAEEKKIAACSSVEQQTRGGLSVLRRASVLPSLFLIPQIPCYTVCGTVENIILLGLNFLVIFLLWLKKVQ